jgi:hypothetical protein
MTYVFFATLPDLADMIYGKGFYPLVRLGYDHTLGRSPLPLFYLVIPFMLIYLGLSFRGRSWKGKLTTFITRAILLVCLFYWLWGFNYLRPNVKEKLSLQPPPVDTLVLYQFYEDVIDLAQQSRSKIRGRGGHIEDRVRTAASSWMIAHDLDVPGRPRIRSLRPGGILLGMSTAGVYFPYAVECHVDAGLHPLILPFVMAHEVAHGFGVTDEGECNFIGSMACISSDDPELQYAGYLQMIRWSYVALRQAGFEEDRIYALLPLEIQDDLKAIRKRHDGFPRYFPERWRDFIYERYLRAQGVSSGLRSYGEALGLILSVWVVDDHSESQH